MNIKNIIYYILLMLVSFLHHILTALVYPIIFLFRYRILKFAELRIEEDAELHIFKLKSGVNKFKLYLSPLFWGFLFTTGLEDKYCGPFWYKKEQKLKWFNKFDFRKEEWLPIPVTLKEKLLYFWLSYCWSGYRNAGWAFQQWFFAEGAALYETIKIHKCNTVTDLDLLTIPSAKFMDKDGTDRNNSGPYIKFASEFNNGMDVTNEGTKILVFKTLRNNERFKYGKTKIYKVSLIKKFLVMELVYGWDTWDGMAYLHTKFMLVVMDDFSIANYSKYLDYLTKIKIT